MISDTQRHQLQILDQAKAMCEAAGIVAKVATQGVLVLCLPVYGSPEAEQLFLKATEPGPGKSRDEGRRGRKGEGESETIGTSEPSSESEVG